MQKVIIFDTTLRDGEQSPGASLNTPEKLIVAKQLAKLGVDVMEAGFPICSDGDFEAVKLISQTIKGPIICGLARANKEDIQRAWDAVKHSDKPRIHIFLATSQIHLDKKLRKTKEEVLQMAVDAVRFGKSLCDDIEFSPEDSSRTDINYMCDVIRAVIKAGATTINIPDTVGYAEPEEFAKRIRTVFEKVEEAKNVVISVHCHNDLGLSVANSLAAICAGALQIECTINGLGERAGNCSLEEVVMNIKTRKDYFKNFYTSINTKEIYPTSQLVANLTGMSVQRNKAIVGGNAFAHEAGIHQHGVLGAKETYEIMNPEEIGWKGTNLVIGKHSGKHAIEASLKDAGYELTDEQIDETVKKVKELADKQKNIEREDIIAIATDVLSELSAEETIVELQDVKITTGNNITPAATISLIIGGEKKTAEAKGVGPVDAVCNAIKSITGPSIKLKDYNLKAITGGTNALADVSIIIEDKKGNLFKAQAINEDVLMASTLALVKGLNKALKYRKSGESK